MWVTRWRHPRHLLVAKRVKPITIMLRRCVHNEDGQHLARLAVIMEGGGRAEGGQTNIHQSRAISIFLVNSLARANSGLVLVCKCPCSRHQDLDEDRPRLTSPVLIYTASTIMISGESIMSWQLRMHDKGELF